MRPYTLFCIESRSVDPVRRDKGFLEPWLDATQIFLGFDAVAEVAGAQAEIRLGIGQVDGDVGEGMLKLCLDGLGMVQGIIADFHEDVDAVAVERTVQLIERPLFCYEAFNATVLFNMHRTTILRKRESSHNDKYGKAEYAFHD